MATFSKSVKDALARVTREYEYICLLGDFNLPQLRWDGSSPPGGQAGEFCDTIESFALSQVNHVASNTCGNILDLVLTNVPDLFSEVCEHPSEFHTDHAVLAFEMTTKIPIQQNVQRTVLDYKCADWVLLRSLLSVTLTDNLERFDSIEHAWQYWHDTVLESMNKCIPQKRIKQCKAPPWIDGEARHLQNVKLSAWKKAKKSDNPSHWGAFRKARNKLKNALKAKYDHFVGSLSTTVKSNPKRFWSFFRSKTKSKVIPHTMHDDSESVDSATEKSALFNKHFHSVFEPDRPCDQLPDINVKRIEGLSNVVFTSANVRKALQNLDVNKAIGPDEISPRVLKHCAAELAPSLAVLFNLSMRSGTLPDLWKRANVTPVFKKGDKSDVANYRPISLLCIVSKIMERCIADSVYEHVESQIHPMQHGFVKGKSCCTQMLEMYHRIGRHLDTGGQSDVIYLDFSKAFDSVCHKYLLHKLQSFGFCGPLLRWMESYLTCRWQRVQIEGMQSDWLPVLSGVPQGSILGPLMFLLYVNDLPCSSLSSEVGLFADDAKCTKEIKTVDDCHLLQLDLNRMSDWSKMWKLNFNVNKCKVMTVSRGKSHIYDYTLDGTVLERVQSFKDLGITVSNDLSWNSHISNTVNKCKRVNWVIKRAVGYQAPASVSMQLFNALSRSIIEFSSPVWAPVSGRDMLLTERVQREMTRFAMHYPDGCDYRERLIELETLPLSYRREIQDLTLFFKCRTGQTRINLDDYVMFYGQNGRRTGNSGPLLRTPFVRTESFWGSYFNRVVRMWNALPVNVRTSDSLSIFKGRISSFYNDKLCTVFSSNDICTWRSTCRCPSCMCASMQTQFV